MNYIFTEYQLNINIIELNQIISAIPKKWKDILKSQKLNANHFTFLEELSVKIGNKYKNIKKITCKEFYWQLLNTEFHRPTALEKMGRIILLYSIHLETHFLITLSNWQ